MGWLAGHELPTEAADNYGQHDRRREILAISGDPDPDSVESRVLAQALTCAPATCTVTRYRGLDHLPPFDLTVPPPPAAIVLRRRVEWADGLLVAGPAHGDEIVEPMMRVIGWLSGSLAVSGIKAAVVDTSPTEDGCAAHELLIASLRCLGARIVPVPSVADLGHAGCVANSDERLVLALRLALGALARAVGGGS